MKKAIFADQVIQTYCGDVTARIRACRTRKIAEQLKWRLCEELSRHCPSEMVQLILRNHVDKIIEETFDQEGNNLFLEET